MFPKLKLAPFFFFLFFLSVCGCKKEINKSDNLSSQNNASLSRTLQKERPNIILFVADDLGIEVPHFTGGESYNTPNLNYMAWHGKYFTQAYSHPDGFPSRLALLSGKYNFRNYTFWGKYPTSEKSIGNLMQDAGYETCYVGKWQNNGGDTSIKRMGFGKYRVFLPFITDDQRDYRYKDPLIYENGVYTPKEQTKGKYSEDLFYEYLSNFIDSVQLDTSSGSAKPFFALYSFNLVAQPYVPSPDHPDYATWNSANDRTNQDTSYFASMVSYLDKIIGQTIKKVKNSGIENNTLILFCADNATQADITSIYNGMPFQGTKTTTTKLGTLTPLLAYWPGTVLPGQKDPTLIDYTDFLPTLAAAAKRPVPTDWGTLDGTSFFDNIIGVPRKDRQWVFCHWDNNIKDHGLVPEVRYTNNAVYKLYDERSEDANFFNILLDPYELSPLQDSALTPKETIIKNKFKIVLSTLK